MTNKKNNQELINIVGRNIKTIRESQNLTRNDLACYAGLTVQAISQYENFKRLPNDKILSSIANALKVSINELLDSRDYFIPPQDEIINCLLSNNISIDMAEYLQTLSAYTFADIVQNSNLNEEDRKKIYILFGEIKEKTFIKKNALKAFKELCHYHNIDIENTNDSILINFIKSDTFRALLKGIIIEIKEGE